jgi:hypothetical protein
MAVNTGILRLREGDADQAGRDQDKAEARDAQRDPHGFLI